MSPHARTKFNRQKRYIARSTKIRKATSLRNGNQSTPSRSSTRTETMPTQPSANISLHSPHSRERVRLYTKIRPYHFPPTQQESTTTTSNFWSTKIKRTKLCKLPNTSAAAPSAKDSESCRRERPS